MRPNLNRNNKKKIVNDPVYGFISIPDEIIFDVIEHPFMQRLRRIMQLGLSHLVYPGAIHTRFHHVLGAMHLMSQAVSTIRRKGNDISLEEERAVYLAILLHDIGHGPFSHALEYDIVCGVSHEKISGYFIDRLSSEFGEDLNRALLIFQNKYEKPYLHQLVSSQLDMDRLDYLSRDSFFTGVSEGVIGYQRILKMLTVQDQALVVEEKGITSVEKFLVSRRLMYWQVYMHKSVVAAEKMLAKIMERAQWLYQHAKEGIATGSSLDHFLEPFSGKIEDIDLAAYCQLDDIDILSAIKKWQHHSDKVLSILCTRILNRKCYKCKMQSEPINENDWNKASAQVKATFNLSDEELPFLCFKGEASNTLYKQG
ncbi:MAG: HD domain-containing protein, partial [Crocinitomicaceae bacterium]|nr:HD domain-containing protein [Crocinitomicaceae bacterium]